MSDININITADEEPKVHMNIMETVPVGKYEEKANKKQGMEEVTDFEAQFLSAGAIQKVLKTKEDVSNKTLGGNYPITHPDCTIAKDEYYASLKYLKECFDYFKEEINASGGGENVDLSNYFTKDEMIEMIEVINNELNEREFTSNRVTVIDEMSMMQGPTYPTARAVFDFVNEKIGDIEALLGGI